MFSNLNLESGNPGDDRAHQVNLKTAAIPQRGPALDYPEISASILGIRSAGSKTIIGQCLAAMRIGLQIIHFDVVGGNGQRTSVVEPGSENTSKEITPELLCSLKRAAQIAGKKFTADVHILDPEPTNSSIRAWIDAGAEWISVHWEAFSDKRELAERLQMIASCGVKAGIAFRPDSDFEAVRAFIEHHPNTVHIVNQNGVLPLFGGQVLNYRSVLKNTRALKQLQLSTNPNLKIIVDGGIEPDVAGPKCFHAGANVLVAGSAFFGSGPSRVPGTMQTALNALRTHHAPEERGVYDILASQIVKRQREKNGPMHILIEAYHAGGKTFTADQLFESIKRLGGNPIKVGLDLSWTDRQKRSQWITEAYAAKQRGESHPYFDALCQEPEPMHWRKAHADQMIEKILNCRQGVARIEGCYQFNEFGDTSGVVEFNLSPDSIVLVEGVYGSMLDYKKWDRHLYIDTTTEASKARAMVRDAIKVRRAPEDTRRLYEDVYEATYARYIQLHEPRKTADTIVDHTKVDETQLFSGAKIIDSKERLILLECSDNSCQSQGPVRRVERCEDCGGELVHKLIGPVDFLNSVDDSIQSMWRYKKLLPVPEDCIVTANEGMTPIRYLEGLSRELGINIWAKLETENPTGTFKDREASFVISQCRANGQENPVMQSTGNTATSVLHYAGLADMPAWGFIPSRCVYKLSAPPRGPKSHLIAVEGHPIDVKAVAEEFAQHFEFPKISPFFERCEANVTQAYEVGEDLLRGRIPEQGRLDRTGGNFDFFVQTLSAGMGLIGFDVGMHRMQEWSRGKVRAPRIAAIEISEFAPAHSAMSRGKLRVGDEVATPRFPPEELFEPTLWTTNIARYYPHLYKMLRGNGANGILQTITPAEVAWFSSPHSEHRRIGTRDALAEVGCVLNDTERSAVIAFAGLAKLVSTGQIPRGSSVIVMVTGKAAKPHFTKELPDLTVAPSDSPDTILAGVTAAAATLH